MSNQEKSYDIKIESKDHIIVRLDGHKFSTFTRDFKKPFDDVIGDAMKNVTVDLMSRFNAYTGYTQSDEITLFIPSRRGDCKQHYYNGRVQKLNSLITSFTTMKFIEYLQNNNTSKTAMFDCRVYSVYTQEDVFSEFLERMRNAERNSKSVFAHTYCPHKCLQNLNGQEMIDLCFKSVGIMLWLVHLLLITPF